MFLNEDDDLQCYITRKQFDTVVEDVKILLVTTENEQKIYVFSTPSVALNLGHRLVKIAKIKIGNAIRQINNMMKKKIERYLIIHG